MRIFVASWFFPPASTSEGNVTYKLLRNSRHDYVVCSSLSDRWTYKAEFELFANNIELYSINTNSFDTWINSCIKLFEQEHQKQQFDAIMTRSMPPESIEFGVRMKELHPDIPWIASLADPIAKSPYDIKRWIDTERDLSPAEKELFRKAIYLGCEGWANHRNKNVRKMVDSKALEDKALAQANVLIFPAEITRSYVLATRKPKCALVVPHSFDRSLATAGQSDRSVTADSANNAAPRQRNSRTITLAFLGFSDESRSLNPLIEAINILKNSASGILDNLRIRIVGNAPEQTRSMVFNYHLQDVISIEPGVNYLQSLQIMDEVDWLIHVDALFEHLDNYGGSVFFAAKLADYMGTNKPILALTGKGSYASRLVREAGGVSVEPNDSVRIAQFLSELTKRRVNSAVNRGYRDRFAAKAVATKFDKDIEDYLVGGINPNYKSRSDWPKAPGAFEQDDKLLTICVPAYNVNAYLDRCLYSLICCKNASLLEVIVVNDGSKDNTLDIALSYQDQYPTIVKVIDKKNGGHGSTINLAIEQASGKYFKVIDGDDWVDTQNLDVFITNLKVRKIDADLITSNYHQVYSLDNEMVAWKKNGDWADYQVYSFAENDFCDEYFTLASSTIKTDVLQKSSFKLQENTYYVDVEYILFPIPGIKTIVFTPEYIYRYAVGNAEQSINFDVFVSRYGDHDKVIRRMIRYYEEAQDSLSDGQQKYMSAILLKHLIKSHYEICLVMDTNVERSSRRAQEFDAYFKEVSPGLYRSFKKMHRIYRKARRRNFKPGYLKRITRWDKPGLESKLSKMYESHRYGSLGKLLSRSDFARSVYSKLKGRRG